MPESYTHSSLGGYYRRRRWLDWVAYNEHHDYWSSRNRGKDYLKRVISMAESERFGLSHLDSASDLIRLGAKRLAQSKEMARQLRAIEEKLGTNPESRV